MRMLGQD